MIKTLVIQNFKCFKEKFVLDLKEGINILVGNNEAGKSTILEAIHLVLTGVFRGKSIKTILLNICLIMLQLPNILKM
ncbi:AAA family ATPase [Bacillus velezensis]|uniref:AAA family ATPase n=1 Tax=Bacillus velezensis TaxID=492670 RepID=UPI0021751AD7|nr:ATP-binding protein [Bacillus velezensis]